MKHLNGHHLYQYHQIVTQYLEGVGGGQAGKIRRVLLHGEAPISCFLFFAIVLPKIKHAYMAMPTRYCLSTGSIYNFDVLSKKIKIKLDWGIWVWYNVLYQIIKEGK